MTGTALGALSAWCFVAVDEIFWRRVLALYGTHEETCWIARDSCVIPFHQPIEHLKLLLNVFGPAAEQVTASAPNTVAKLQALIVAAVVPS